MCIYIPDTMQGHSLGMQPAENVHIVILRNHWNPLVDKYVFTARIILSFSCALVYPQS